MRFSRLKKRKFWKRVIFFSILLPSILISVLLLYVQAKQDDIIQNQIASINEEHQGLITIGNSQLSLFGNFPHVSIKINKVNIYETKMDGAPSILDVESIYVGFNIWDIINGNYDIQSLLIKEGAFNIVMHENSTTNLQNALTASNETEGTSTNIHLKKIKLRNLDIHKLDETTNRDIETFIYSAKGGFKKTEEFLTGHIDAKFELNVIDNGDTTYINHKDFELHTDLSFNEKSGMLTIKPSGITMEHGDFNLEGSLDTKKNMTIDLSINGTKPNFDMLIAFAPENLIPVLERYKNEGEIYFNAVVQGPMTHGQMPFFDVNFGASEAFLENTEKKKRINEMGFKGHFTNGEERTIQTMVFSLTDMAAKLESGKFLGSVVVRNFEEPEVDMQIEADFDLEFMARFLNLNNIENSSGKISLKMNFHDIVDLDHPELALTDLNRAYFSELKVEDLSISSANFRAPLEDLDMHLIMNGKEATLDQFNMLLGKSDVSMTGYISDLPSIVHHTDIPVTTHLEVESNLLDLAELTGYSEKDSTGLDEQITDLSAGFSFKASAKDFTESKYLPRGEFFVDSLHAQLKHYPHKLHDFHVDFLIDDRDIKIVDFIGFIDNSDFHLNGLAHNYGFWFQEELNGDVDLDITLTSDLLRLENIFSYKAENYVPEDYRHEEFEKLILHVNTSMHYKDSALQSIDVDLDKLNTKMHVHPMRMEDFRGRFHYEDDHLIIEDFHGKIGKTVFDANLNYYLGEDKTVRKRDNHLNLQADYIDYDQLFNVSPTPTLSNTTVKAIPTSISNHQEAFNLYELPFTDMRFDVNVDHFIYHRIDIQNIDASLHTTENHYLYVDTLNMHAAGGSFKMSGYFNGSNPKNIYLKPNLTLENVSLDKLLFKFENFGQDHLVSENLHGKLSSKIEGKIKVYPDMVPDLNESEIHIDVKVLEGRLENYEPMSMLSSYMGDKNLKNIRFDTLQNHLDITKGRITIPSMTIESTLGHMELSGTHDSEHNIDYFLRIPWKTVKKAAIYKLFGNKKNQDSLMQEEKIIEVDSKKKVRYLNLKIQGHIDEYEISLGKNKDVQE
ncbi:MAG: AsmA-like C-terminal region-containing protein [Bacteroidota bacterium]